MTFTEDVVVRDARLTWREHNDAASIAALPDVEKSIAQGTFYASRGRIVIAPQQQTCVGADVVHSNKKFEEDTNRSLVSLAASKCLGPFPKSAAAADSSKVDYRTKPPVAESAPLVNDSVTSSASDTSPKRFPHRVKKQLKSMLSIDFTLPDLPSLPLPSLPSITVPTWRPTDSEKLELAEAQLMKGCEYQSRFVAGLNTLMPAAVASDTAASQGLCLDRDEAKEGPSTAPSSATTLDVSPASGAETNATTAACNNKDNDKDIVVLVHGFAGGSAMWAQNWAALSKNADVYAFDLPGFARSHRDKAAVKHFVDPQQTIQYNCLKFEEWFEAMKFTKPVILCGHSFGAYLSAFFVVGLAEKYSKQQEAAESTPPQDDVRKAVKPPSSIVKHLVLADPWGMELVPKKQMKKEIHKMSARSRIICKMFYYFSPLGGLRAAGPIGPKLVPAIRPDLADGWHGEQRKAFFEYVFHCNAQIPPSGELAFRACVMYAGHPRLACGPSLIQHLPDDVGITALYGEKTMMDASAGWNVMAALWDRGHRKCRWYEVSNAGHQIFSENAKEFNDIMNKNIIGK